MKKLRLFLAFVTFITLVVSAVPVRTARADTYIWRYLPDMLNERKDHTATLLMDGRILVVGGYDVPMERKTELFDPASGNWVATGNLNVGRAAHTATLLRDGRVLVAGGWGTTGYLASAEIYDPATGAWSLTGSMSESRENHTATLLQDGRVLVAGGFNRSPGDTYLIGAEIYDPASGAWSAAADMDNQRSQHTATLLPSGNVLVVGGKSSATGYLSAAVIYSPSADIWIGVGGTAVTRLRCSMMVGY